MQTNINSKFSGQKYTAENYLQQKFEFSAYTIAVQLPPKRQFRQDHLFILRSSLHCIMRSVFARAKLIRVHCDVT